MKFTEATKFHRKSGGGPTTKRQIRKISERRGRGTKPSLKANCANMAQQRAMPSVSIFVVADEHVVTLRGRPPQVNKE